MSKTCLVQNATPANTWNGLGNGMSGPSLWNAGESFTSVTASIDDQGRVHLNKSNLGLSTNVGPGETLMVSAGTGLQQGFYEIGDRVSNNELVLACPKSYCIPQRFTVNFNGNPANNDQITLGGISYTFKTVTAAFNDIFIGANATATYTSFLAVLGLTGTAAASGADYFTASQANPLWQSGGINAAAGSATGTFYLDQRIGDYRTTADPIINTTGGTGLGLSDSAPIPPAGQTKIICTNASVRLVAARNDRWSGQNKIRDLKAVALSGTAPTITTFAGAYVLAPGASSGPFNSAHDPLTPAIALALPLGIEVDLGDFLGQNGGIAFRILGTTPVVLLTYD